MKIVHCVKKCDRAYATRASEQGPNAGKWDNSKVMEENSYITRGIGKIARFQHLHRTFTCHQMAENPQQVLDFLDHLAERAKPQGEKELQELKDYCEKEFGVIELAPWDIGFYSEKQKQHLYAINDEELRPYFPENRVISGLFELIKRIFNIRAVERKGVDTWHKRCALL